MYLSCGCHITRFIPPCRLAHTTCNVQAKGARQHRDSYDGRLSLGGANPGLKARRGGWLQTDTNLRGDSDGPRFTAVSTSTVLPMRHRGNRAEPWVPCATSFGTARQGKEGGFRPPSGHGARSDPSHPCRRSVSRVLGTGLLANRFRPQSCLTRRVPTARPT